MEKLLHERLRDYANSYDAITINGAWYTNPFTTHIANLLSDEIERYYIPRPRFDDGEPVQFGDEATYGFPSFNNQNFKVKRMNFYKDGSVTLCECGGNGHNYQSGEPVKRPSIKVLDADGVEIKEGDTVWPIDAPDMKMTVDNFQCIYGQSLTVNCEYEGEIYNFNPEKLTHKEPDSLEKLRDDMRHDREASLSDFASRFLAIMERGA